MDSIKIECYLSNDCGSEAELRRNIEEALRLEGMDGEIKLSRIDEAVARALGFQGSPTVLINGRDIAPPPASMQGFLAEGCSKTGPAGPRRFHRLR